MFKKLIKKLQNKIKFKNDVKSFLELGGSVDEIYPVMNDWYDAAGNVNNHYFHQDLLVAKYIFSANPRRHIDIGSRIDGFVAHVASFREVEVLDIRPMELNKTYGIHFHQADLMDDSFNESLKSDSVSCLHALEHFGLGRYGDPICPNGHIRGFRQIWSMVESGGILYISFPIASISKVFFNAHRVFSPNEIFQWFDNPEEFELATFDYIDDKGLLYQNSHPDSVIHGLQYGCGIYSIKKR